MSHSVTQCGGCKAADSVKITIKAMWDRYEVAQPYRRAECRECGRIGPWKHPEEWNGLTNEAHALMYAAPTPQGAKP